jgi:hypothetical protein
MKEKKENGIPEGIGYLLGIAMGVASFFLFGIVMENIPMGIAWFTSGYAIGIVLEKEGPEPMTSKQRNMAVLSGISGIVVFTLSILYFNILPI